MSLCAGYWKADMTLGSVLPNIRIDLPTPATSHVGMSSRAVTPSNASQAPHSQSSVPPPARFQSSRPPPAPCSQSSMPPPAPHVCSSVPSRTTRPRPRPVASRPATPPSPTPSNSSRAAASRSEPSTRRDSSKAPQPSASRAPPAKKARTKGKRRHNPSPPPQSEKRRKHDDDAVPDVGQSRPALPRPAFLSIVKSGAAPLEPDQQTSHTTRAKSAMQAGDCATSREEAGTDNVAARQWESSPLPPSRSTTPKPKLNPTTMDRLSASSDIPKKEGAKNITLFLSLQNGRPRTAFELSKPYSYCTMACENRGVGAVNAGAPRPCRPRCTIRREAGTACPRAPLPARRGRHWLGAACPRGPLSACAARRGQGEGWGRGVACSRVPGGATKGGRGRRSEGAAWVLPFRAKAEGWDQGGVPPCCVYGAGRSRGKGSGRGRRGEGAASSCREGLRVACPHVHPSRARTGRCALVHLPSARMGKGGAVTGEGEGLRATGRGGGAPTRTGRVGVACVWRRSQRGGRGRGRRGEGAACWSAPLPCECGRVGPGRVPLCRARGGGVVKRAREVPTATERGGGAPLVRTPSTQTGKGGARGGVPSRVPFPLPARRGGAVKGEGEGRRALVLSAAKGEREGPGATGIGGGVTLPVNGERRRRRALARMGREGEGGGGCPHAHPFSGRRRQGEQEGGKERDGGPSCAPFPRKRGEGRRGARVLPFHANGTAGCGRRGGARRGGTYPRMPRSNGFPLLLSSPRLPHSRRVGDARGQADAPHRAQRGAHEDKGHTMPLGLPGPPFSPIRATTSARKGGTRGHAVFSLSAAPHCGKRAHEGTWPPPLPFPLGRVIRKGGTRPPTPPFPIHAEGRMRPPPPFPLATPPHSHRMGACEGKTHGKGTLKGTRLLGPSLPRSRGKGAREACHPLAPSPFARKGGTRGHASPRRPHPLPLLSSRHPAREARHPPALPFPPWPRRAVHAGNARACHPLPHSHAAPGPSPLAAPPRMRGKWACEAPPPAPPFPHWHGRVLHAGTPPSTSLPPWPRRPVRVRRGDARAFARKGVHAGTPPPSRGKGRTRASHPRLPTYRAAGLTRSQRARVHRAHVHRTRTTIFARHSTT
ncbi:hypothetical protein EDB85DRAFT_1892909 [Lactarius pseudohatsudake]|nr:hypothetical protein EDB85DRAFT_1892909 [Lactarius pseudohatsudake]